MKPGRSRNFDTDIPVPRTERPPNHLSGIYLIMSEISNKKRLKIIEFLMNEPKTPSKLSQLAGISFQCCHAHLRAMRSVGIVERIEMLDLDGRKKYYRLAADNAPYIAAVIENLRRIRIDGCRK